MKKKIPSHSFAARLTPAQRDELFAALADGLSYREAAEKIRHWIKTNDEAGLNGARAGREIKLSEATTISKWYHATVAEQRYAAAREVALVARAHCPPDYEEQTRRALGQARLLAILEGLRPRDIALLEKNEIAREKLALEREKLAGYAHRQRVGGVVDQANKLAARAGRGEKSADLARQIDHILKELDKLKQGKPERPPDAPPRKAPSRPGPGSAVRDGRTDFSRTEYATRLVPRSGHEENLDEAHAGGAAHAGDLRTVDPGHERHQ